VDLPAERFSHFPATNVCDGVQRKTVEQLIVVQQILPDAVENEMQKLVLLVQKQRHGKVANLFLRVLGCRDELDGFEMPKVDIPS
jgi:hypothetical protein